MERKSKYDKISAVSYTHLILRTEYHFQGYIHVKAIPGASPELIEKTGYLADRMSVNLELPTDEALKVLAPQKKREPVSYTHLLLKIRIRSLLSPAEREATNPARKPQPWETIF